MKKLLTLLTLISSNAFSYSLLDVEELSTEFVNYNCKECSKRNPYVANQDGNWKYGIKQYTKLDLIRYEGFSLDFDNMFFLDSLGYRVEYAGLEYFLGFTYKKGNTGISIGYFHHSSHIMDKTVEEIYKKEDQKYPLEDSIRVKLIWRAE